MKKEKFYIKTQKGFMAVDGYIVECNGVKYGIAHSLNKDYEEMKTWNGTHIDSGLAVCEFRRTRQEVIDFINENSDRISEYYDSDKVKTAIDEMYTFLNEEKPTKKHDFDDETIEQDISTLDDTGTWEKRLASLLHYATIYHPMNGGTDEIWERFIDTYKADYELTKNIHVNSKGETYISETMETADEMVNIVNTLSECDGLINEILGRFIWTGGNTRKHKDVLKSLGFTYMSNKKKWCKSYKGYVRRGRRNYSYEQIRTMYGTDEESAV